MQRSDSVVLVVGRVAHCLQTEDDCQVIVELAHKYMMRSHLPAW